MPLPTMSTTNSQFFLSATANGANTLAVTLSTENKFVDKNIRIEFTTPAASGASLTLANSNTPVTILDPVGGSYLLQNSLTGSMAFTNAGWSSGASSVNASAAQVGTIPLSYLKVGSTTVSSGVEIIPDLVNDLTVTIATGYETDRTVIVRAMSSASEAAATITGTTQAAQPTLANLAASLTNKTLITASPSVNTDNINKYYIKVRATAPVTNFASSAFTASVTAGYLSSATQVTVANNAIHTTSSTNDYYIPVDSGAASVTINATASAPTANSSSATLSGKTKISSANMVPTTLVNNVDTYYVPFSISSANVTATASDITKEITTPGYVDSIGQINVSANVAGVTATYYMPIDSGSLAAGAGSVSSTSSNVIMTEEPTTPAAGSYYITINGSGIALVGTAGWLPAGATHTSNVATKYIKLNTATATTNGRTVTISEGYVPSAELSVLVALGELSTGTTSKTSLGYTSNNSLIIPSLGYLYIKEGYYNATLVSLDQLLGGNTDTATTTVAHILAGYTAYDVDGKLLTGTIATYDGTYSIS